MAVNLGNLPTPAPDAMGRAYADATKSYVPGRLATILASANQIQEQARKADELALKERDAESVIEYRKSQMDNERAKIVTGRQDALAALATKDLNSFLKGVTTTTLATTDEIQEAANNIKNIPASNLAKQQALKELKAAEGIMILSAAMLDYQDNPSDENRLAVAKVLDAGMSGQFGQSFLSRTAEHSIVAAQLEQYGMGISQIYQQRGQQGPTSPFEVKESAMVGSYISLIKRLNPAPGSNKQGKTSTSPEDYLGDVPTAASPGFAQPGSPAMGMPTGPQSKITVQPKGRPNRFVAASPQQQPTDPSTQQSAAPTKTSNMNFGGGSEISESESRMGMPPQASSEKKSSQIETSTAKEDKERAERVKKVSFLKGGYEAGTVGQLTAYSKMKDISKALKVPIEDIMNVLPSLVEERDILQDFSMGPVANGKMADFSSSERLTIEEYSARLAKGLARSDKDIDTKAKGEKFVEEASPWLASMLRGLKGDGETSPQELEQIFNGTKREIGSNKDEDVIEYFKKNGANRKEKVIYFRSNEELAQLRKKYGDRDGERKITYQRAK
jgi:hypothetical protein